MKLKKIIYAKKDKDFKMNGCINIWSADYPDIKNYTYTFSDDITCLPCKMEIYRVAKIVEGRVREKNNELPFKIHIKEN